MAFVSVSLDKQPLTESLQGNWYRQCDSKHVGFLAAQVPFYGGVEIRSDSPVCMHSGEICGSSLFWNPQWGLTDVSSPLSEGGLA